MVIYGNKNLEIENLKKEKKDLNSKINIANNQNNILNNEILNLNNQIKDLKLNKNSNLSLINPGETIICIHFMTYDEK